MKISKNDCESFPSVFVIVIHGPPRFVDEAAVMLAGITNRRVVSPSETVVLA
jgi:hypothetical protein